MAISRLNYKAIPAGIRAGHAKQAQARLQAIMADPVATPEQRQLAQQQLSVIRHWVRGSLPEAPEGLINYPALAAEADAQST